MNVYKYHPRRFGAFQYVYPVISRRSGGLSLGVNLSPAGLCNFACVYCQVLAEENGKDKEAGKGGTAPQSFLEHVEDELRQLIGSYKDASLFRNTWLESVPTEKRELRDIAFSGDGEPTLFPQFNEAVKRVVAVRNEMCRTDVKIVLITNASTLHSESVRNALTEIVLSNGEIWAKLDAGTAEYFQKVSQSSVPFEKILTNLQTFSQSQPLIIQTCFFNLRGKMPDENELKAYTQQLQKLRNVRCVQLYTVARDVPEPWVEPLEPQQLDNIADDIQRLAGMEVKRYY
ncbi:MAG: hypothetical protein LBT46_07870 [Planctomycetaceae bacterium]|jgi:wyosine [tRNA(Phe)-imidazoG37] synthetase (radical SAM superfamily)|nr:hypothetical protein [Planctomycetaceae bacterium]